MKKTVALFLCVLVCAVSSAQRCKLYTPQEKLSSSLVNAVYQDRYGTIWVGTENGLNSYDGTSIRNYFQNPIDPHSLSHNVVRAIFEDRDGHLIIGTQNGVQIFDRENNRLGKIIKDCNGDAYIGNVNALVQRANGDILVSGNKLLRLVIAENGETYLEPYPIGELSGDFTHTIMEDSKGNLWISKFLLGLYKISPTGSLSHYLLGGKHASVYSICEGDDGVVYVGTYGYGMGYYDAEKDALLPCDTPEINNAKIDVVYNLGDYRLLVGTDSKGALEYNIKTGTAQTIFLDGTPLESTKLKIHDAKKDSNGNLWLGVYQKGLAFVPMERNKFHYLGSKSADKNYIGSCCVTSLMVDKDKNLWVGTDNDGIYTVSPYNGLQKHYATEDGIPVTIFDLMTDTKGYVWFGTYNEGLWRMDPNSGRVTNAADILKGLRRRANVYAVKEDNQERLWIGTMGEGLLCYDMNTSRAIPVDANLSINSWINGLMLGRDDKLYISTYDGVYVLDISDTPTVKSHILKDIIIYCLYEDEDFKYFGTASGLFISDRNGNISEYTVDDGLPNNMICSVGSDKSGRVWIGTSYGLSVFDHATKRFVNFYVGDGLQGNEFTRAAFTSKQDGSLFFGGPDGVTCFLPDQISDPESKWNVKITSIQLADRDIFTTCASEYRLDRDDRSCVINFAPVDYNAPDGITFKYRINNGSWTQVSGKSKSVSLSNLKPGKMVFEVKSIDNGIESDPTVIHILIPHAWYESPLAMYLYVIVAVLLGVNMTVQIRTRRKSNEELEKHRQAEEVNESKLQFFMNVSHEIRTPMSLIESPLQKLIETDGDPERQRMYKMMARNARRILQLISQMLDIRKIDKGQMKLHFAETEIIGYCSEVFSLFTEQARKKNITMDFRYALAKDTKIWVDPNQFDKIIINLVSNAIKFTPEGGKVTLLLSQEGQNLKLEVKDTGIGMPEADLERVFERFYQSGQSSSGTGIGLNLTYMLAGLHHGSVKASNNQDGPGSTFKVLVPMGNAHLSDEEMKESDTKSSWTIKAAEEARIIPVTTVSEEHEHTDKANKRRTVLVADDDIEIRSYLHQVLSNDFYISECSNGKQALEMILHHTPDLVISDVMMPEMDGLTLCKKIRKNININSIPIILLTAKALDSDTVEGLEVGADAYIAKPFNIDVLRSTAINLINTRERLKVAFTERQTAEKDKVADPDIKTPDERLMARVMKVVNDNISNPSLTVEMIAAEVGISRVHLHRKLKELTNQTSRDFVRNIRLQKAAEMLSEKKHSIAELADAVGFSNSANFATAFKELYGVTPTEYMNRDNNETV